MQETDRTGGSSAGTAPAGGAAVADEALGSHPAGRPGTKSLRFRKRNTSQPLSRDESKRQGEAVKAAIFALGSPNAPAFLNLYHAGLRGRPLDLAIASDSGLEAVAAALCVEARRPLDSA